jgi:hypothetical protein
MTGWGRRFRKRCDPKFGSSMNSMWEVDSNGDGSLEGKGEGKGEEEGSA